MIVCLTHSGCALLRSHRNTAAPPPPATVARAVPPAGFAPPPRSLHFASENRVGTIKVVGRGGRFVLVETLSGSVLPLPDGQELHCRASGEPGAAPTADLRLSRERRPPFVAADVVDGNPKAGDAVFVGGASGAVLAPEAHVGASLLPIGAGGILPPPVAGGR